MTKVFAQKGNLTGMTCCGQAPGLVLGGSLGQVQSANDGILVVLCVIFFELCCLSLEDIHARYSTPAYTVT